MGPEQAIRLGCAHLSHWITSQALLLLDSFEIGSCGTQVALEYNLVFQLPILGLQWWLPHPAVNGDYGDI